MAEGCHGERPGRKIARRPSAAGRRNPARPGGFHRGSRPFNRRGELGMRYMIAWLLGVPLSVLVVIWLIWG
jgi:hypothetical protein